MNGDCKKPLSDPEARWVWCPCVSCDQIREADRNLTDAAAKFAGKTLLKQIKVEEVKSLRAASIAWAKIVERFG